MIDYAELDMLNPDVGYVGDCPEIERHTARPDSYLEDMVFQERMAKTHRQLRCPVCGFWAIWVPRRSPS